MMAMAAIVAQNGATGQSLVEQFTTGNLKLDRKHNPKIRNLLNLDMANTILRHWHYFLLMHWHDFHSLMLWYDHLLLSMCCIYVCVYIQYIVYTVWIHWFIGAGLCCSFFCGPHGVYETLRWYWYHIQRNHGRTINPCFVFCFDMFLWWVY